MESTKSFRATPRQHSYCSKATQHAGASKSRIGQHSSFVLFITVIVLVNLCPFEPELGQQDTAVNSNIHSDTNLISELATDIADNIRIAQIESCFKFVKLMFTNPVRLAKKATRHTLAEAKVLGKMAKVWYLKKKFKKLGKKLKKHTIAVPVFTAIPIYEHSYYPQPHVTHVTHHGHHGMHHAASAYSPGAIAVAPNPTQQLATAASTTHSRAVPYRMSAPAPGPMYPPGMHPANTIINAYAPSPPMYVDENGGLYGTYGNAYGRYDGGFHTW